MQHISSYKTSEPLDSSDFEKMTPLQAEKYFQWYLSQVNERVHFLSRFSGIVLDHSPESLIKLWTWFLPNLKFESASSTQIDKAHRMTAMLVEGAREVAFRALAEQPTLESASIMSDISVYYGQMIVRNFPVLQWRVLTDGAIHIRNRPVLTTDEKSKIPPTFVLPYDPLATVRRLANAKRMNCERNSDLYEDYMRNIGYLNVPPASNTVLQKTKAYDILIRPLDKPFEKMTAAQARNYFDWFMAHIDKRADYLAMFSGVDLDDTPESLIGLWSWFLPQIRFEAVSAAQVEEAYKKAEKLPTGIRESMLRELTEQVTVETGYIILDMAMYYGRMIIKNNPRFRWGFQIRGSALFRNRPIITSDIAAGQNHCFPYPYDPLAVIRTLAEKKRWGICYGRDLFEKYKRRFDGVAL